MRSVEYNIRKFKSRLDFCVVDSIYVRKGWMIDEYAVFSQF